MRNKKTVRQRDKNAGFDTQEDSDTEGDKAGLHRDSRSQLYRETRKS
jgi:hypothetical protein